MDPALAPYVKKFVRLKAGNAVLQLHTAHGLFSSHTLDAGTRLLLRTLTDLSGPTRVLDLGCGYGALGLSLKAMHPAAHVHMVDRDALAVAVAALNADRNGFEGVDCYGSLAYDGIDPPDPFDLVVSNLPGKAGLPVIEELLLGAGALLHPEGWAAVVIVSALAGNVDEILRRSGAEIGVRRDSNVYSVFHYRPPQLQGRRRAFTDGVFLRHRSRYSRAGLDWGAATVWGLPEFDSLGFGTLLMVDLLVNAHLRAERALIVEPGQGHLAMATAAGTQPESLTLIGRDLLALTNSYSNLVAGGFEKRRIELLHEISPQRAQGDFGLVLISLADKLPMEVANALTLDAARRAAAGGTLIVGGRSTAVTRALEVLDGFEIRERSRRHGFSAVRLRKGTRRSGRRTVE